MKGVEDDRLGIVKVRGKIKLETLELSPNGAEFSAVYRLTFNRKGITKEFWYLFGIDDLGIDDDGKPFIVLVQ